MQFRGMNEPAPSPSLTPAPAPSPAPSPEPSPAPAATTRPEGLPESYFDPQTGIKPEFGQHYAEIATAHKTFTEQQAALAARKPEDIKFELKLPDTVKLPEGLELKINPDDPRIPILRDLALKNGWSQDQVNDLVALDAQQVIASHAAEATRLSAEKQKLGANADDRIKAAASWVKGLQGVSAEELAEVQILTATSAGVSLLEKLMSKASGAVPGAGGHEPQTQSTPATVEQRWYGQKG
jgi:hypothetical protein